MKVAMKHPGMWDDFLRASSLDATGQYLEIGRGAFDKINRQYFDGGLGTLLHEVLGPFVAAADAILGTNLADCGGCGERELKINNALSGPDNPGG
jgi:hypothetical protein